MLIYRGMVYHCERTDHAFLLGAWGKLLLVIEHKLRVVSGLLQFCFCSLSAAGGGRVSERWSVSLINKQQPQLWDRGLHRNLFFKLRGKLIFSIFMGNWTVLVCDSPGVMSPVVYQTILQIWAWVCEAYVLGSRWFSCRRHHQTQGS